MNDGTASDRRPAPPPQRQPSFAGLVGVGRADITPPVGIYARNWGAATTDVAEGIYRPLTATALAIGGLRGGRTAPSPLVFVALDLGWWTSVADEWHVRGALIERFGLDPARVMINLSHTHAGPSVSSDDRDLPGGHLIPAYLDRIRDAVIEAAGAALDSRQRGSITWIQGRCDLARNRDQPDPDRPRIVVGYNPAAPADDTLLVGRVSGADGTTLATIANYACHPTTLAWQNPLISPDYVGAFRELVEATTGAPALFLQGASGELQPREAYSGDPLLADAHGRRLGHAVLSALEGLLPPETALVFAGTVESGAPLGTWERRDDPASTALAAVQFEIELPLKPLQTAAELRADLTNATDRTLEERARRKLRVREMVGDEPVARMPAWVWQIGDAYLVGQVNEAYSGLQTELRARFAGRPVIVTNLTNGSCAYLAPAALYDEDIYQVWQSPFERGCLERTIEATSTAIQRLDPTD